MTAIFTSCFYPESRMDLYIVAKTNLSEPVAQALVVLNDKEIGYTNDEGILRSSNMLTQRRTFILKVMKKSKYEKFKVFHYAILVDEKKNQFKHINALMERETLDVPSEENIDDATDLVADVAPAENLQPAPEEILAQVESKKQLPEREPQVAKLPEPKNQSSDQVGTGHVFQQTANINTDKHQTFVQQLPFAEFGHLEKVFAADGPSSDSKDISAAKPSVRWLKIKKDQSSKNLGYVDQTEVADLFKLASQYFDLGEYNKALRTYQKFTIKNGQRRVLPQKYMGAHMNEGICLYEMARQSAEQTNNSRAEQLLKKSRRAYLYVAKNNHRFLPKVRRSAAYRNSYNVGMTLSLLSEVSSDGKYAGQAYKHWRQFNSKYVRAGSDSEAYAKEQMNLARQQLLKKFAR